jgi:cell division protein FtsW (lipid II flippase)
MKKLIFPFKNPSGNVILSIFITWLYVFGVLLITIPIITLSEAETPERWKSVLHIGLMVPGFIYFFKVILSTINELRTFRFLIYPLLVVSFPAWFILTLLGFGATILWFVLFLFPVWLIGIPTAFIVGLILDLNHQKSLKNKPNLK